MLTVAANLFAKAASNRSGIGATKSVNALRSMVPFVLPANISLTQPTHCGRGMIVPVTGAKNTAITVTHNLGRLVQGMWPLINNGGKSLTPKLMYGDSTAPSLSQQSITADEDLVQCLILFF